MTKTAIITAALLGLITTEAAGQVYVSTRRDWGRTTADSRDYCVNYSSGCTPRTYDYWYYHGYAPTANTKATVSYKSTGGRTTASKADYCSVTGPLTCTPKNYEYWYYNSNPYSYTASYSYTPAATAAPQQVRQALPAMPRISDIEYGEYVEQALNASSVAREGR